MKAKQPKGHALISLGQFFFCLKGSDDGVLYSESLGFWVSGI
jgi:hypothetical protein